MSQSVADRKTRIRELNDALRCNGKGGRMVMTAGLAAKGDETVLEVSRAVAAFSEFNGDNDPHGEHDCASLEIAGLSIIWKIDYYDLDLKCHSPDEADPSVTTRVMTVMLAEEY